jgi:hypothetical protein
MKSVPQPPHQIDHLTVRAQRELKKTKLLFQEMRVHFIVPSTQLKTENEIYIKNITQEKSILKTNLKNENLVVCADQSNVRVFLPHLKRRRFLIASSWNLFFS